MTRATWRALVCLFGLITAGMAQNYTIGTAAGGANPYFFAGTGDGGPAINAGLANLCYDVALDGAGNLYIVAGSLIRKVTASGIISTVAGGGTSVGDYVAATQAQIAPVALASDAAGDLYIADTAIGNSRIRKVDTNGIITTVAGGAQCCALGDGGKATSAYIDIPYGVAVDAAGNIYIAQANSQNNLIRKVTAANGNISTVAGGGTATADGGLATGASLLRPTGVAVDAAGNLYIADATSNRVRKVSSLGIITTVAGNGAASNTGDGGLATQAGVDSPWHVAVDAGGNLYITQINDAIVRMVTAGGTITTIAGMGVHGFSGDGGPATSAVLDRPAGIAQAPCVGAVYIADATYGIARVRRLTPPVSINLGGVVPVYSASTTIQASSWVSIYGTNLAAGTTVWNGNFPTSLGNTSVTINSKPAYLWFVSPTQINLQPPDDNTTGVVNVAVTTSAGSASCTVTLGPYAPSLSLFNAKYAAAIVVTPGSPGNSGAGYDYIGPAGALPFPTRPAKVGETVILFGVGFGPTNPHVPAGQVYSGAAPSVTMPQISIGGLPATVSFAGIVEAGLFQFNVVVPKAGSGDQELQTSVNGVAAPAGVFITLQ
ncbi:MAG: hypothetical protein ABSB15_11690 [Bryobacteraceae bacterium]|jgi:uncharacterized protein (TIGR03437 family)